jgi:hypothetical protein
MTQVDKLQQQAALLKMQVQNILNWDDMEYARFQEAMGLDYLERNYGGAPLLDEIPKHREYWSWWRLHWMQRDLEFVEVSTMIYPTEQEAYYRRLHNPEAMHYKPHGIILRNTYEHMMRNLVKNATRKEVEHE